MINADDRNGQRPKSATVAFADWRTRHDRFKQAIDDIQRTHAMSGVEGVGMLLMGIPGLGKSSILASYIRHHLSGRDDLESPTRSKEPIILVSVPAEPTLKTLIQEILLASSYEGSIKGTVGELKQKLNEFIRERGVELLIFDEFQHFLREQAKSNTRGVVNHIKLMMDKHKLAVVMAGTPAGYRSIAHYDELYQRFAQRQTRLTPFQIDSEETLKAFGSYLRACTGFLERQGVEFIPLANKEMMVRVFVATKGIPRLIAGLIKVALESADEGRMITQKHLAEGFSKTSMNPDLKTFNPFRAPYEKVLERAREAQKKAASEDRKSWDIH
ncbi:MULTISPECIES: TniB family NTP-binding protein [unclassified Marinobacter]|uniref:TniB family NTP-binding protein n=1 Tax=unclassified Marinobacter TaxID=83889 RepID=UPI0012A7F4EB|nr:MULTISPECIES: TniB family NTP-binding protein [unclassified Marinobacter]QFS88956.1 Bacterial TniB protein [Marinobacter sp. THAF197a]QFT52741.1 Bacterial TniB protein [Marinobacter sp. THAF39]